MKLIINTAPQLTRYVYVKQNEQTFYDGEIPENGIDISGISDGKVEIGLGRYAIPLDVKTDSTVIINDTRKSRWYANFLDIFSIFLMSFGGLFVFMDYFVLGIIILCVAIVALLAFTLMFLYWYRNKPEKKYKVFIV